MTMSNYQHSSLVEERFFHLDVEGLRKHSPEFDSAYSRGEGEIEIGLGDLYAIAPRRQRSIKQYRRLGRFLKRKGVDLQIVSRKTKRLASEEAIDVSNHNTNNNDF